MAFQRVHTASADGTFSSSGAAAWNAAHGVSGATVGGIPYFPTATSEAMSGMTWNASGAAGEGLAIAAGTATTAVAALSSSVTLNNAAAITLTVPSGLGANFACALTQLGAGQVTVTPSSTTVNSYNAALKLAGQYAQASLFAYAANTFVLSGNIVT